MHASAPARQIAGLDSDSVYLVSLVAGHNLPLACPGLLGASLKGGQVATLPSRSLGRPQLIVAGFWFDEVCIAKSLRLYNVDFLSAHST
jgi:hypothetical protein